MRLISFFLVCIPTWIFLGNVLSLVVFQEQWPPQREIPIYEETTEEPPLLIADQNRVVHAFNSQPVELKNLDSPRALFYRQWTPEGEWSDPVDVLYKADDAVNLMALFFDQMGVVHLLTQMKDEGIYYSQVPLAAAGKPQSWSIPKLVAEESMLQEPELPFNAAIDGDDNGRLAIIYSGYHYGMGIYGSYSDDNGISWSEPVPIFLTYNDDLVAGMPKLISDHIGQMHAVWSVFNTEGIGVASYYARFDIEQRQWSEPVEIDEGGLGLGIKFANMVEYENTLILTYYNGNQNALWWRQSLDSGDTWSEPARISPDHVGTNGPVSFAVDGNNVLHLFFGQRVDDNNHGLWHTFWTGNGWGNVDAVVRGPQIKDISGGNGFDPRSARAVIVNGNLALVTWGTDGAAGVNGAWYSYAVLDAPELPRTDLPEAELVTGLTTGESLNNSIEGVSHSLEDESLPTPTALASNFDNNVNSNGYHNNNPVLPIVYGMVPLIILLPMFIGIRQVIRNGRD